MPANYHEIQREGATHRYGHCYEERLLSGCAGQNYLCKFINVVFGVFLRESAATAAKSRTNYRNDLRTPKKITQKVTQLPGLPKHSQESRPNANQNTSRELRAIIG